MAAAASYSSDNAASGQRLSAASGEQTNDQGSATLPAHSTFSLSIMRQAFNGLVADGTTSPSSSAGQRDELGRSGGSAERFDRVPNAFKEEVYSYQTVQESWTDVVAPASKP